VPQVGLNGGSEGTNRAAHRVPDAYDVGDAIDSQQLLVADVG
jgi:hypothetical protein